MFLFIIYLVKESLLIWDFLL